MAGLEHLYQPITLGNTRFRNRLFSAPTGEEYFTNSHNHIDDRIVAYFERKAKGGAATASLGSVMVDLQRGAVGPSIHLDDPTGLNPFFTLANCVSRHGAVADIELQHSGANSYHSLLDLGGPIYGAFDSVNGLGMEVPEMPEDVILETIQLYGNGAQVAKHCGFGMVTIHAGHGWLLNQFLSDKNNRRDQWGGSMENRARIVVAICQDIKKKCGQGFPVTVRISGSEMFSGGYDIDYGVEIAKQLDGHCDMINVSVGAHEEESVFTVTHPSMFLADGCNVRYAAEVKKHVTQSKVAAVGALTSLEEMEEIVASGQADVVMMARQLIADPDTPLKGMTGHADDVRRCIRCFECFSQHFTTLHGKCAINPEAGFEREVKYEEPEAQVKKRVLVCGGGVGGMQAAITAADRGHEVILCEKGSQLGGCLRCEANVPFKANLQCYLDQQARHVQEHENIDLRMETEATPELARQIAPDVIIAAFGSDAIIPTFLPGYDGDNVMSVDDALADASAVGDEVAILGGGLSGVECGIYLAKLGRRVKIVERSTSLGTGNNVLHAMAIDNELEKLKDTLEVLYGTAAVEITQDGVVVEFVGDEYAQPEHCDVLKRGTLRSVISAHESGGEHEPGERLLLNADTVIYALGQKSRTEAADALVGIADELHVIGDCAAPSNVYQANAQAWTVAMDLGRY